MSLFSLFIRKDLQVWMNHRLSKSLIKILFTCFAIAVQLPAQSPAGNAFNADGDDFVYPLTPNASGLTEGTVEFWFSTDAWSSSQTLWCGGNGLPGVTGDWTRFGTHSSVAGNYLAFGIYAGVWRWVSTGIQPEIDTWYHVAASWGSAGMKIYLNGKLSGQNGFSSSMPNYATELVVASAWGIAFSGEIDELRIWNVARDSAAITSTYMDTLGSQYYSTSDSGLIAYYRMDIFEDLGKNDDGADDLRDMSVNANHMDAEGDPVLESSGAFNVTAIEENLAETVDKYYLNQNYPNPFNPATTIQYTVGVGDKDTMHGVYTSSPLSVDLSIYNSLGQKITTLVSEPQAAGTYTVQWNASGMTTGIYLYKLSIGQNTQIRKMIYLK